MPVWPHKGLIIKSCRQESCKELVDPQQVKIGRRPAIDGFCLQAVAQSHRGCRMVSGRIFTKQLDKTRWLLNTGAHDTAWTMIFERACCQKDTIRQQGRGKRIPVKPGIGLAVEFKFNRLVAIDLAT